VGPKLSANGPLYANTWRTSVRQVLSEMEWANASGMRTEHSRITTVGNAMRVQGVRCWFWSPILNFSLFPRRTSGGRGAGILKSLNP
jgi:hypothetical protein